MAVVVLVAVFVVVVVAFEPAPSLSEYHCFVGRNKCPNTFSSDAMI